MGIVVKQSIQNTLFIYAGFLIGGVNVLFLYTQFLSDDYYGMVTYLLSTSNIFMPLVAFGVHFSIIKFFSVYEERKQKDRFLSYMLILPMLVALPMASIIVLFYNQIANYLSFENEMVQSHVYSIFVIAVLTAYFEVFYAWSKVHLKTVYGNMLKEMYNRVAVMVLLFLVYFNVIAIDRFIFWLTCSYVLRMLLMASYALYLYRPKFSLKLPFNNPEVIRYCIYILLAGAAGSLLLDIDKFMIPQKKAISMTAYYTVAVFIGTLVESPGRAMSHILNPLVAKAINKSQWKDLKSYYKESSLVLLFVCGLIFLLINVNLNSLYVFLPEKYSAGSLVVLMISGAKLFQMALGVNNAIIINSKYYKILLPFSVLMALSVILSNLWLIDVYGINGAAFSTLSVVFIFNVIKLVYVYIKFKIIPFQRKTFQLVVLIGLLFLTMYFWKLPYHPLVGSVIKSILITVVYLVFNWHFKWVEQVNKFISQSILIFTKRKKEG